MQIFKTLTMKKSLFIGALIAMAGLSFQSCEKLSSINENPNEPSNVDAGVLFTEGVRSSVSTSVTQSYLLGNVASQLAAKTLRAVIGEYSWNAFPNTWNQNYASLGNIIEAERVAAEAGNAQMEGAAKVMKSWVFSTLTLAYGDIPYTEAITGSTSCELVPRLRYAGTNHQLEQKDFWKSLQKPYNCSITVDLFKAIFFLTAMLLNGKSWPTQCASVYLCTSRRSKM